MSEAAQGKEKVKWAIDKPKLDNARRLRGIYFIDPEDAEFKENVQIARRKIGSALHDHRKNVQRNLSHF